MSHNFFIGSSPFHLNCVYYTKNPLYRKVFLLVLYNGVKFTCLAVLFYPVLAKIIREENCFFSQIKNKNLTLKNSRKIAGFLHPAIKVMHSITFFYSTKKTVYFIC